MRSSSNVRGLSPVSSLRVFVSLLTAVGFGAGLAACGVSPDDESEHEDVEDEAMDEVDEIDELDNAKDIEDALPIDPDDPSTGVEDILEPGIFVRADAQAHKLAEKLAYDYIELKAPVSFRGSEVHTQRVIIDQLSTAHVRVEQRYRDIPVFGGEAIVHLASDGRVDSVSDRFVSGLRVNTEPRLTASDARALAMAMIATELQGAAVGAPEIDLQLLRRPGSDHLTYRIRPGFIAGSKPTMPVLFIDAHNGGLVWRYDDLKIARNRSTHDTGTSKDLPGTLVRSEGDAASGDPVLDAAHDNVGVAYDYFYTKFGRDSYDGKGATIRSTVHFDKDYVNAYWNGSALVYGDGDGKTADALTSLDIVTHELSHAVTTYSSNLVYANESGALNEAMSDVFAAAVEAWHDGGVSADTWKIGEDCWTPGVAGDALRQMNDPAHDGDRDYYPDRYVGDGDHGGVHTNSGIANLAFYLLSQGGTHPRGKTSNLVSGIGIHDAAAIFYRTNTTYLTSSSTFADARAGALKSARDLFGASSDAVVQVAAAWAAVGVVGAPEYELVERITGQSGAAGVDAHIYAFDVGDARAVRFVITGGSGDADLFVRRGDQPTASSYDCRPYESGNDEACEFNPAGDGTLHVMLNGYEAYEGLSFEVWVAN